MYWTWALVLELSDYGLNIIFVCISPIRKLLLISLEKIKIAIIITKHCCNPTYNWLMSLNITKLCCNPTENENIISAIRYFLLKWEIRK